MLCAHSIVKAQKLIKWFTNQMLTYCNNQISVHVAQMGERASFRLMLIS